MFLLGVHSGEEQAAHDATTSRSPPFVLRAHCNTPQKTKGLRAQARPFPGHDLARHAPQPQGSVAGGHDHGRRERSLHRTVPHRGGETQGVEDRPGAPSPSERDPAEAGAEGDETNIHRPVLSLEHFAPRHG